MEQEGARWIKKDHEGSRWYVDGDLLLWYHYTGRKDKGTSFENLFKTSHHFPKLHLNSSLFLYCNMIILLWQNWLQSKTGLWSFMLLKRWGCFCSSASRRPFVPLCSRIQKRHFPLEKNFYSSFFSTRIRRMAGVSEQSGTDFRAGRGNAHKKNGKPPCGSYETEGPHGETPKMREHKLSFAADTPEKEAEAWQEKAFPVK